MARVLLGAADRGLNRFGLAWRIHQRSLETLSLHVVALPVAPAECTALHGLRVAFLTDIHMGCYMDGSDLTEIFQRLACFAPDLVCLGGDLINTRPREVQPYRDCLAVLKPPLGVFAVPGNHDHYWDPGLRLWEATLRDSGVTVLRNRGVRVRREPESLWIAGIEDLKEGAPNLDAAMTGRRGGEPCILLSHNPDAFVEAALMGVDLTLSGHTHGGQIKLGGRILRKRSKLGYDDGVYTRGDAHLYVSRGVGVSYLPMRIGVRAEVPIIELRAAVKDRRERA